MTVHRFWTTLGMVVCLRVAFACGVDVGHRMDLNGARAATSAN